MNLSPPSRPWRVIAAEIVHEPDPEELSHLLQELGNALDEQEIAFSRRVRQITGEKLQDSRYRDPAVRGAPTKERAA